MKYDKLIIDIVKDFYKNGRSLIENANGWTVTAVNDDRIMAIYKGVACYFIDGPRNIISNEKMSPKYSGLYGSLLIQTKVSEPLTDTRKTIKIDGKITAHEFTLNDTSIYIEEKYLKYFDDVEIIARGTKPNTPVAIYEGETLVGYICPIRVNKEVV